MEIGIGIFNSLIFSTFIAGVSPDKQQEYKGFPYKGLGKDALGKGKDVIALPMMPGQLLPPPMKGPGGRVFGVFMF